MSEKTIKCPNCKADSGIIDDGEYYYGWFECADCHLYMPMKFLASVQDTVRLDYWLENGVDVERGRMVGRDVFAVVRKPLGKLITDYHPTARQALDDAMKRILP